MSWESRICWMPEVCSQSDAPFGQPDMLGSYLALYDGDINRTMMAYNLGKSGAERAWNAGTRSTAYTDKVWSAMVGLLEEERDVS